MFDSTAFAAHRAAAEAARRANDAILIAEARRRVAAGLPATEPGPDDCIQIGDYFLDRRQPPDVVEIVAQTVRAEADFRLTRAIRDARQRIANGTHSQATKDHMAAYADDGDDEPDPPGPAGEPRVNRAEQPAYGRNAQGQNTLRADTPKRSSALRVLTPTDCAASVPRGYIVKGLIAPRDLFLMVAKPGGGKSALAPSIGYAIAQGQPVFGRRTKPGLVLYVPVEDPHGMRQRVHALKRERGDAANFLIVEGVADLFSAASPDPAALLELATDRRPALIVIDTMAAAWRGLEENEGRDMARVISVCRSLNETGTAVMLLCHPNKSAVSDGIARGHSSLNGDADVGMALEWAADGGAIGVRLTKNRNGPTHGAGMAFTIRGVRVGTDEDGDAIYAPVADEIEGTLAAHRKEPTANETALAILTGLIASEGQPLPDGDGYPPGLSGVADTAWRDECDRRRLSISDVAANRGRAFQRAFKKLLADRAVEARDGVVWIPRPDA